MLEQPVVFDRCDCLGQRLWKWAAKLILTLRKAIFCDFGRATVVSLVDQLAQSKRARPIRIDSIYGGVPLRRLHLLYVGVHEVRETQLL